MDLIRRNDLLKNDLFDNLGLFDSFFAPIGRERAKWSPGLSFTEQDSKYVIEMDAPGMAKDDISISVEDGALIISGKKSHQREKSNGEKSYIVESYTGEFARSVRIPVNADDAGIAASMKNGVLIVTLPKSPGVIPRQIDID